MSSERVLVYLRVGDASAAEVAAALDAVLAQEDVDFEVLVVDDASASEVANAVAARGDSRVRVIRNARQRGAEGCRAQALAGSAAAFIAEVPETGVALPGALAKLVAACAAAPSIGIAHGFHLSMDAEGRVSRDAFRARRRYLTACFGPDGDLRRDLLLVGDVVGPLRLYRREAFALIASPPAPRGEPLLAATVRIAARFDVAVVREFLFRQRTAPDPRRFPRLRRVWESVSKALACRSALRPDPGLFAPQRYAVEKLLATRVARVALSEPLSQLARWARRRWRRLVVRPLAAVGDRLYFAAVERGARYATLLLRRGAPQQAGAPRHIGYYLWHFPVLSQTFVNRELAALGEAGVRVDVFADGAEDIALADHNAAKLLPRTHYLDVGDKRALARYRREILRERPIAYARVRMFAILCRYTRQKRYDVDLAVFRQALLLAGMLREKGITHVHAPWADQCAHVALMAARLAGVPYSIQARAHEIHRRSYQWGLREKLEPAAFVVTNTRYNEAHLRALVGSGHAAKVHVIHNGIDLPRFELAPRAARPGAPVKLLCVARLIEQKGLTDLLDACYELGRRGIDLRCDVVGGPEEPRYTSYRLELMRRHRRLGLETRVRFVGARPLADVLGMYRVADIFVLPCVVAADGSRDITPNALIEAMAMQLPVVSTAVGGVPEIVEHGVSGLVVPPGNVAAFADAIAALIRDPDRAALMGAAARRRVEEKFDIAKNIQRYVELFSDGGEARRTLPAAAPAALARATGD